MHKEEKKPFTHGRSILKSAMFPSSVVSMCMAQELASSRYQIMTHEMFVGSRIDN